MKKPVFVLAIALGALFAGSGNVAAQGNGCPEGSYSVVLTPDGGTLTILFSDFVVEAGDGTGQAAASLTCRLQVPLQLPPDTSVGVYRVDYRGFAALAPQQRFELEVTYGFNEHPDHSYRRQINGVYDADFAFTQNIGGGLMRRVGCGEAAVLDIAASIRLDTRGRPGYAVAAFDSLDGAPAGGLVYHFSFGRCQ